MNTDGATALALPVALAIIMVGIGLTLTPRHFSKNLASKPVLFWGLMGQIIGVPIIGILFAWVADLPPMLAVGLVLLAAAPGGVTTNLFAHLAKGNVPLSIVLTVLASIAMMVTMPFWVWVGAQLFHGEGGVGMITVPPMQSLGMVVGVVGIPIGLGMYIRYRSEVLAHKLEKLISIVGVVTIVVAFAVLVLDLGSELIPILERVGVAVIVFNGIIMALGWFVGYVLKRPVEDKIALAMEYGLRNSTLAMVIALSVIGDAEIAAPSMLFSVTMYVFGIAAVVMRKNAMKKAEPVPVAA